MNQTLVMRELPGCISSSTIARTANVVALAAVTVIASV